MGATHLAKNIIGKAAGGPAGLIAGLGTLAVTGGAYFKGRADPDTIRSNLQQSMGEGDWALTGDRRGFLEMGQQDTGIFSQQDNWLGEVARGFKGGWMGFAQELGTSLGFATVAGGGNVGMSGYSGKDAAAISALWRAGAEQAVSGEDLYNTTAASRQKWDMMMGVNDWADKGGQPGQFTNLTPDDIMGFTQWMAQDKELAGISVEAQAQVFGQFGPMIEAGGYDLQRHKRLSIQAQMGADPYKATMDTGAMMGIGQLDFEKLHGLMEAVSNMGPIEQKTLEATSEMFKSLHGPIALAQGGEDMFEVATRQVKDVEATKKAAAEAALRGVLPSPAPIYKDQEYIQVNQELIDTLNNPARNELYQAA